MMTTNFTKRMLAALIMFIMAISFCCSAFFVTKSQPALAAEEPAEEIDISSVAENGEKVFSYVTVFEKYYAVALAEVQANGGSICSFDEFCDGYYEVDMNIQDYTDAVISNSGNASDIMPLMSLQHKFDYALKYTTGQLRQYASSTYSEAFTLKEYFEREPVYDKLGFSLLDSELCVGDIIIETQDTTKGIGHAGLIIDTNHEGYFDKKITYIQTIDALAGVGHVALGFLDDDRMAKFGVEIYRAQAGWDIDFEAAVAFSYGQLGKPYDSKTEYFRTDIRYEYDNESWYSAELVLASFCEAGIYMEDAIMGHDGIWPVELASSGYLFWVKDFTEKFLTISIVEKIGNHWSLKVYNHTNDKVYLDYNLNMCFVDDAKNWKNLSDTPTVKVNLPAGQSTPITITENLFATAIAISYVVEYENYSIRYITYADSLDEKTKTMSRCYNYIETVEE